MKRIQNKFVTIPPESLLHSPQFLPIQCRTYSFLSRNLLFPVIKQNHDWSIRAIQRNKTSLTSGEWFKHVWMGNFPYFTPLPQRAKGYGAKCHYCLITPHNNDLNVGNFFTQFRAANLPWPTYIHLNEGSLLNNDVLILLALKIR